MSTMFVITVLAFTLIVEAKPLNNDEDPFIEDLKVLDVLKNLGHIQFLELLEKYGLDGNLTTDGPFTLFAPTDEAFNDEVMAKTDEEILEILQRHIVQDYIRIETIEDGMVARTLNDEVLEFNQQGDQGFAYVKSGDSPWIEITFANVEANNGLIHEISQVIF